MEARVLRVLVLLLQAAEQIVVLVGGEVVLGLVPVGRGGGGVVRGPGHVLQESLPVGEDLVAPDTGVEVDTTSYEVDHFHLQT